MRVSHSRRDSCVTSAIRIAQGGFLCNISYAYILEDMAKPKVVAIDHISLSVRNFKKSKEFYGKLLGFLGFSVFTRRKNYIGWSNKKTRVIIMPVLSKYKKIKHSKGMVGFHHYGFEMSSRKDVDAVYQFLLKNKYTILDPAGEYYGGPFYAVFFTDPDGLKLECMHYPK